MTEHEPYGLEPLGRMVMEYGGLMEVRMNAVLEALRGGAAESGSAVPDPARSRALAQSLQHHSMAILALRHPVAGPLRVVLAARRLADVLEAMEPLLDALAERAWLLRRDQAIPDAPMLVAMGEEVASLLRDALDAYVDGAWARAEMLRRRVEAVHEQHHVLCESMVRWMHDDLDNVSRGVTVLHMAKDWCILADACMTIVDAVSFVTLGPPGPFAQPYEES